MTQHNGRLGYTMGGPRPSGASNLTVRFLPAAACLVCLVGASSDSTLEHACLSYLPTTTSYCLLVCPILFASSSTLTLIDMETERWKRGCPKGSKNKPGTVGVGCPRKDGRITGMVQSVQQVSPLMERVSTTGE